MMSVRQRWYFAPVLWLCLGSTSIAEPAVVYLAGDSIMAQKLATKRPETGWGEKLQAYFDIDEVRIENHARNGRSTRTFIEEDRWESIVNRLRPGDCVFIQFGHNDSSVDKPDRYTSPEIYRANLLRFIADVRDHQAIPVLLTPVMRRRFDDAGVPQDSHGVYPDIVRDVAAQERITLLDMHKRTLEWLRRLGPAGSTPMFLNLAPGQFANYPAGLADNTHFTDQGAAQMAELVVAELAASNLPLAKAIKRVVAPPMVVVHEEQVVKTEPPPHGAIGMSTVYRISDAAPAFRAMEFRKRTLHVGSAIGLHPIDHDEVYYVLAGAGDVTSDGVTQRLEPGMAAYLFKGATVGITQTGETPLTIIVSYPNNQR